jgi:hypothetical protein
VAHKRSHYAQRRKGVFSEEQAKRLQPPTTRICASYHGSDWRSTDREVPHLTERTFKSGWIGKTLAEKYEVTRDTMPPREERSLQEVYSAS